MKSRLNTIKAWNAGKSFLQILFIFLLITQIHFAQWQKQTNGLPVTWGGGSAIDASDSNNVVFSASWYDFNNSKMWYDMYNTTDGGILWHKVGLPDSLEEAAIDVSIIGSSHFWVATELGKIVATTDAGLSWTVQFADGSKTQFMNYIEMFDEMNGVAMGDAPFPLQKKLAVFLRTTDGGINWVQSSDTTLIDVFSGDTWRRLDFINPEVGYFYESGINPQKLLKTTDGCASWSETNYAGSATVIKCFDENIMLVQSRIFTPVSFSKISKTIDGGDTWTETQLGDKWGNDFEFIPGDASKVFFTDSYKLFFSSDTGKTWQEVFVDSIDLMGRDIVFPDQNHGWILGDSGRVYKSNTGGIMVPVELTSFTATSNDKEVILNWSTATELNNQGFEVQRKFGSNDFVTVGSIKGHGTTTFPNQYTFVDKILIPGKYFYRIKQIDFGGKYEYSQTVEINWSPFTAYKLEQNYPNPFNPSTKIKYSIPSAGTQRAVSVQLKVYDILGNEVATLVNEEKPAGNYEVQFNGSKLSNGVYFYRIQADSFTETKKMMVLK